jgi:hypothetical protein
MPRTPLSQAEERMWESARVEREPALTDQQINEKYIKRELRIVTENNREQLPNFVDALRRPNWMELRPFYQRRERWDEERQSKLIESFIMNMPVPPLFVYEADFAKYEVMDGQQRISAIFNFYENRLKLKGLQQWPELNGRIYDTLPSEIKKGIDRRSIAYIVLLKESATTTDEEALLRQQVFERLNTGGVELANQEIRHCIYHCAFDELLIELTKLPVMRTAWGLPLYSPDEEENPPKPLLKSQHYAQMRDAEVILRFFALRHADKMRGGMQSFLDQYMVRSRRFSGEDINFLRTIFTQTLELTHEIYADHLFHPWDAEKQQWMERPQIAFTDAVLVSFSSFLEHQDELIQRKSRIIDSTKQLFETQPEGTFTGQRNTKSDVQSRISLFSEMLGSVLR